MYEIEQDIYKENLKIAKTMLELAKYLQEQGDLQLKISKDYLEKVDSADNEVEAQVHLDISEFACLESDENFKLSVLLSRKAQKLLDEV